MKGKFAGKACRDCPAVLGYRNTSGLCRRCFGRASHASGAVGEKISATLRRKVYADPEFADGLRERARRAGTSPAANAARTERWRRDKPWIDGLRAARTPEARAKAACACSETRMAWCPPHLRAAYRELVYSKRLPAAEARAMVLEQDAIEVERVRRAMGAD